MRCAPIRAWLVSTTIVGLSAVACERRPSPPTPTPAFGPGRLPAVLAEVPIDAPIDAVAAIASAGPITAARMVDLPAPKAGRPVCIDQADPYALATWPVVVDRRGDVITMDDFGGQLVVQPAGSLAEARVLAAVPRTNPLVDEQLGELAIDDTTVFFLSNLRNFDASEAAWAVRAVPRAGGAALVIARGETPDGYAASLAVDATHVYFLHHAPQGQHLEGTVWRVAKHGGEPVPVVRGLGAHFAWFLAGDEIFYHSRAHAEIRRVPTAGGEPRLVVATPEAPGAMLVAAGALYFTTADLSVRDGPQLRLHAVALAGAPSVRTIARYDGWLSSVRHDGESVYWAEFTDDSLDAPQRVLTQAGDAPPRVVYEPIGRSEAWAIHDGKVYWGTTRCVLSAALAR